MRAFAIGMACAAVLTLGRPAFAQEAAAVPVKPVEALQFQQPDSVDGCLGLLEKVIEHALGADMLDDQIDKSEAELERMESACYDKRFSEAVDAAKVVVNLVAANK